MKRSFIWFLFSAAAVAALAIGSVLFAYYSETGCRWLVQAFIARSRLATIEKVSGSMHAGVEISNLGLLANGMEVTARHGTLQWRLSDVVDGIIHLPRLHLKGVTCTIKRVSPPSQDSRSDNPMADAVTLPVLLDEVTLEALQIHLADGTYDVDVVSLAAFIDPQGIRIDKLQARSKGSALFVQGGLNISPRFDLSGNLQWRTILGNRIAAGGRCSIQGDIRKAELGVTLKSPFALESRVEIQADNSWTKISITGKPLKSANPSIQDQRSTAADAGESGHGPVPVSRASFKRPDPGDGGAEYCSGDSVCLAIKDLGASLFGGEVKINGYAQVLPEKKWSFRIEGEELDPGKRWPEFSGRLDLQADIRGHIAQGKPIMAIEDLALSGALLDQPINVSGSLQIEDIMPVSQDLRIRSGGNSVAIKGALASSAGLSLHARLSNPEHLWPGLMGNLELLGHVRQDGDRLLADGQFKGEAPGYGAFGAMRASGTARYDSAGETATEGQLEISSLRAEQELLSKLKLAWSGDIVRHRADFHMEAASAVVDMDISGRCDGKTWEAAVSKASLFSRNIGDWRLESSVNLFLSHSELSPVEACFVSKSRRTCGRALWQSGTGWKTEGDLTQQPLKWLAELINKLPDSPYGKYLEKK